MKGAIFLVFLTLCSILSAKTYYVVPTGGSDSNSGTDTTQAWATWQKAFDVADAGDTVYFRDGVWYLTTNEYVVLDPDGGHGNNGTYAAPICFFNYPGEKPILDAIGHTNKIDATAFDVRNATYTKFRGLTIRNEHQNTMNHWIASMQFYKNGNLYIDRITCHSGGGYGIWFFGYDTLYLTNCDSYNHCDTLADDPGNRSDGYQISSGGEEGDYTYVYGCRAWRNSDDGIEISTPRELEVSNCWSFSNGYLSNGEGHCFKYSYAISTADKRKTHNCLAACSNGSAFAELNLTDEYYGPMMQYLNNTAYQCNFGFTSSQADFNCETGVASVVYCNNIVYHSTYENYYDQTYLTACGNFGYPTYVSQSHNTWTQNLNHPFWAYNDTMNWTYTGKDAQFLSVLDSANAVTALSAARQSDGSLPEITFMRLASTSNLVDKGIDVGFGYNGVAPDLGAWECDLQPGTNNTYPFIEITSPSEGSTFTTESVITISVNAEDTDGSINKIEFYNASDKLGESNSEPWSFAWDNLPIGSFYLTAVATDNLGAKATSSRVYVQVKPGVNMIFPNPNNGIFTFALEDDLRSNADIKIASIEGIVIYKGTMFAEELTKQFDLSYIKTGIYILMLNSKDLIETIKFIKE